MTPRPDERASMTSGRLAWLTTLGRALVSTSESPTTTPCEMSRAGSVLTVYRIGDSGAQAAWTGQFSEQAQLPPGGGPPPDGE